MPEGVPTYKPDKAPRSGGRTNSGSKRVKADPNRPFKHTEKELREALESATGMLTLAFSATGDMHCARVVAEGAPDLIESWLWLAGKHPEVRRALEVLCGGGGYLALITSTLGVALPIMQHHGMYPKGAPTPRSIKQMMGGMFPDAPDTDSFSETADDAVVS